MKKYLPLFAFISILILTFSACEKDFNITIPASTKKVVVEGYIENNLPPYVFLSNTLDIFGPLNVASISSSFIHNAKITISDGTNSFDLKEYTIDLGANKFYIYTIKGFDFSGTSANQQFVPGIGLVGIDLNNPPDFTQVGKLNKTYKLSIQLEGETSPSITSTTEIKYAQKIDSLWVEPRPGKPATDEFVSLFAKISEKGPERNYFRYFTKRNNEGFLPGYNSIYDDNFVNGTTYNVRVLRGIDKTLPDSVAFKNYGLFRKGDTITVKIVQIDKNVYDFWKTLDYANQNTGNPYASPGNVKTNIVGGLGVWCGYASYNSPAYQTLIVPK
jgi:hypothetical protein